MTSPRADKPSRKTKDYQEVHSRGSSFGQNLNESKVRELLSTEVQSPFAQFVIGIGERFASFAADIANAIKGEGAKYTVITGAVDERLGPIDTSITETGKRLTDMELEVGESIREQDKLIEESKKTLEETGRRIAEAEQAVEGLAAADAERRLKVEGLISQAEQFTKRADKDAQALEKYKKLQAQKVNELTTTADDALARASKIVDSQGRITGDLKKARDDASDAVSKLTTIDKRWQNDITNAVQGLVSKAQLELAKAEAANDATKEIQDDLKNKNSALAKSVDALVSGSQAVKSAAGEAREAAQALENMTDIGGSLIPVIPGTNTPSWSRMSSVSPGGTAAAGFPIFRGPDKQTTQGVSSTGGHPKRVVKVAPGTRYRVSLTARCNADKPSSLYIEFRDAHRESLPVARSSQGEKDETTFHDSPYPVEDLRLDGTWRTYTWLIEFADNVTDVYLDRFFWNHPRGEAEGAQFITDFRVTPFVDQATIDRLQTNAILKNEKVGSTNATAIQVMEKSWEAQKVVNKEQEKWNAAATEAREANTAAARSNTQAIKALARIDTGGSLVLYEDLTDAEVKEAEQNKRPLRVYKPSWATAAAHRMDNSHSWLQNVPVVNEAWGVSSGAGTRLTSRNWAKVEPGMVYRLSYWHRAAARGSKYFIQMATPKGESNNVFIPLTKWEKKVDGETVTYWVEGSPTSYVVFDMEMPSGRWEKVDLRFKILDDVSHVSFHAIYWNHPNGTAEASQYIANMEFSLDVPTQQDVDAAQDAAIQALDKEAKLSQDFREEQLKLNKANEEIDKAQNRALRALNAPDGGTNVIPAWASDDAPIGETLPAWAANADRSGGNNNVYPGFRYREFRGTAQPGSLNKVAVDASLEYDFTVWLHGTNNSKLFIELRDQDGNHAVESGGIAAYTRNYSKGTVTRTGKDYLVNGCTLLSGWTQLTSRITLRPGTRYVYVGAIYGNHPSGPDGAAFIGEDMSLSPHVPSQAEVDLAQNRAIESNSNAIRALARIDTGSSLILYEDLTDDEVADAIKTGNIPRAYKPSWATATNTHLGPNHGMIRGNSVINEAWGVNSKTSTQLCRHNFAKVEPGMVYKLSYWHRAGNGGSKYYIKMATPKGEEDNCLIPLTPVEKTVNGEKVTEWKEGSPTSYAVVGEEMPPYKWVKVEKRFRILEDVSKITFHAIYWNHPNGTAEASQYIANMEFSLDVPTQQDVDAAQDEALRSLEKNQALDEKFKAEQRKQNALNNSQLMVHKDLLELLDIRTPKVKGWSAGEGTVGQVVTDNPYSKYGAAPHVAHSYFETWEYEKELYVACRGQWVGQIRVSINWDNGAIDDWSVHVKENERIFCFVGGATHIKKRYITVTVYPRSLMRTCTVSIRKGNPSPKLGVGGRNQLWDTYNYKDINRLIRVKEMNLLRLKNTVTCNRNVVVTTPSGGKRTIKAGEPIDAADLYPEYQLYTGPYTFKELDDPVKNDYRADPTLPSGRADVIHA